MHEVRVLLSKKGVQTSACVRGYVSSGRVRSTETKRNESADSVLRELHGNRPGENCGGWREAVHGGTSQSFVMCMSKQSGSLGPDERGFPFVSQIQTHCRTVFSLTLVTVQTDYPSLLSIHRPIHRPARDVDHFSFGQTQEKNDLIIVDTSGRHKQQDDLFEEMRQVSDLVKPNMTIFVMDGSIGQASLDQARAFKATVDVGSVIVTKLDGHAKGGGAISAVAATKSPIIFIGTGEHIDEFEPFDAKPFVSRLLGLGDWSGFMDKIADVMPMDSQPELLDKLEKGQFTMRILYEQFANIQKMGPMSSMMSMIPGLGDMMPKGAEKEGAAKVKRMMTLMDSMTDEELDCLELKVLQNPKRMERIGRGAGCTPAHVVELIEQYKQMAKMMGKMKGLKAGPKKGGHGSQQAMSQNLSQMASALPPDMLKQIGGMGGLQGLMKQFEGKDAGDMQGMMQKMMGGKGGMPGGMGR